MLYKITYQCSNTPPGIPKDYIFTRIKAADNAGEAKYQVIKEYPRHELHNIQADEI